MVRQRLLVDLVNKSSQSLLNSSASALEATGEALASRASRLAAATGAVLEHTPSLTAHAKDAPEHPAVPVPAASITFAERLNRLVALSASQSGSGVLAEEPAWIVLVVAGCLVTLAIVGTVYGMFFIASLDSQEHQPSTDEESLDHGASFREDADDTDRADFGLAIGQQRSEFGPDVSKRTTDAVMKDNSTSCIPAVEQVISNGGHTRDGRKLYKGASQELKAKLNKAHSREVMLDLLQGDAEDPLQQDDPPMESRASGAGAMARGSVDYTRVLASIASTGDAHEEDD